MRTIWIFLFFALTLIPLSDVFACRKAISELKKALAKVEFDLKASGSLATVPRIKGHPLHFTSQMGLPFVWVTNTARGTDYSVFQKSQTGFGFSRAPVFEFPFLKSESLYLRSLDVGGDQRYMLATLIHEDEKTKKQSLLFNMANISDGETGRLLAAEHDPIVLEDVLDPKENLVVSTRPGTGEFWLTDSSHKIRVLEFSQDTGILLANFEVPGSWRVNKKELKVEKVLKLQFFSDSETGYLKFEASDGKIYLAPVSVFSSRESSSDDSESEPQPIVLHDLQLQVHYEKSKALPPHQLRSSTHPEENLVFVTYASSIEVFRVGSEIRKIAKIEVDHLTQGYRLDGIEFYWEGQWIKEHGKPDESARYQGDVKAFLLLWDEEHQETRLSWVQLGG